MIPAVIHDQLLRRLVHNTGYVVKACQQIRVWRLSGVERVHLSDGGSVIFKYAARPFTAEHEAVERATRAGAPVARLHAAVVDNGHLGMFLDDLGASIRDATIADLLAVTVALHSATKVPYGEVLDEARLAALPQVGQDALQVLHARGRFTDVAFGSLLARLQEAAYLRAEGAQIPPFGLCHGELHHSALHVGVGGRVTIVDWAMAHTGPGLLDLVSWFGTRTPPEPHRARALLRDYVASGGPAATLTPRGGLPAEVWALGWHRVQAAVWYLTGAASGAHGPDTDRDHEVIVHRQLRAAASLLAP